MPAGAVAKSWTRLGVIAGRGQLPVRVASAEADAGRIPFVIRLAHDEAGLLRFPHTDSHLGEVGRALKRLRDEGCDAVCFAGHLPRPDFSAIKPDWRGAVLLPKVLVAARRGDGAIIDVVVKAFEDEGFEVVGAEEAAGGLLIGAGALGDRAPTDDDLADIEKGSAIIEALGPFDVGQGAVVRGGFVLAVEAAEGTDAMLHRCRDLPSSLKGFEPGQRGRLGVLVKQPKPGQELRVDLPTIGVPTVQAVAAAGLTGIAVAAEKALVVDQTAVREAADREGVFVYGFKPKEVRHL